ncbi:MCE family protein [Nocardia bovistercoris]|uniref:MCE family protein n=1 Tax=Nocardia bovistercoris TaxID=2785916 RepID=A0A931IGV8_9NOCA|nr:MCE family protein [Nocardia bovistercoris]MBH0781121.1 MCE family protein [Nocardia bovistercoris]
MTLRDRIIRLVKSCGAALIGVGLLVTSGCAWSGVESLPLPGAQGRGSDATVITVEMANVGTLVTNSPVLVDDVVVGSVSAIKRSGWHAAVEVSLRHDAEVPANVVATIGQTSLLGSSHLALNTPDGTPPAGKLASGSTIPLNKSSTFPSTGQTLASLSVVVNGGGLGQIGDIIADLGDAFDGRQEQVSALITRLDTFMGTLDDQRDQIVATMRNLERLAATFAVQRDVLTDALNELPKSLEVLVSQRQNLTTALDRLRIFSDTATGVVREVRTDLVTNLSNLEPTLKAIADVGPKLNAALAYATVYPYGQKTIDRAVRGDYINLHATVDLTVPRLRKELLLGTPWGDPTAVVQAAIGDPGYATQTRNPLGVGIEPAPAPQGGR